MFHVKQFNRAGGPMNRQA